MSLLRSFASYQLGNKLLLLARYRSRASTLFPYRSLGSSAFSHGYGFSLKQGLTLNVCRSLHSKSDVKMEKDVHKNHVQPLVPSSRKPAFPNWAIWALGSILSLLFPFWKKKWEKILRLEGEMEKVAETVETVAEVVEKVARVTEKVSAEVVDKLPDNGKLKDTARFIESVSKEAVKDAHLTKKFIHKVDELKQEVETFIEPIIEPIIDAEKVPSGKEARGK